MALSKEQEEWLRNFRMQYLHFHKGPVREEFCDKGPSVTPGYLEAGFAVQHLPDELKTEALCLAAVRQDASSLEYIPEGLKAKVEAALNLKE